MLRLEEANKQSAYCCEEGWSKVMVVDEHRVLRLQAEALHDVFEDLRVRLRQPDFSGYHDAAEQIPERMPGP